MNGDIVWCDRDAIEMEFDKILLKKWSNSIWSYEKDLFSGLDNSFSSAEGWSENM